MTAPFARSAANRLHHPFGHGARNRDDGDICIISSYHCSRYNTNTGRLTVEMFNAVFTDVARFWPPDPGDIGLARAQGQPRSRSSRDF
jgi:uracil-DNA glycosylase